MGQDQGVTSTPRAFPTVPVRSRMALDMVSSGACDGAPSSHVVVACLGGAIDVPTTFRISTSSPGLELARCSAASLTAFRSLNVFSEPTLEM